MNGEMTDARREAMGWVFVGGQQWEHPRFGRWWAGGVADRIVPLQEENARLKAELAELRRPKEWAAGQVWRYLNVSTFLVVRTEAGSHLALNIDSETGRPCASDGIVALLNSKPCARSGYLGTYTEMFQRGVN